MMAALHIFRESFDESVGGEMASQILKKEGIFRLALSGGSTPVSLYRTLSAMDIPWNRVEIYLVDERYVPLNSNQSNYKMITDTLLKHISELPKKFVFFDTRLSIDEALQKYESELQLSNTPFFDLVLLGLGTDGHIASLFPYADHEIPKKSLVAHTTTNHFPVHDRLTLTLKMLLNSGQVIFLMKGKEKELFVRKLMREKKSTFPASALLQRETTKVFLELS